MQSPDSNPAVNAALAAHRFGLGEPQLSVVGSDARGWLVRQIGPGDPARGDNLVTAVQALYTHAEVIADKKDGIGKDKAAKGGKKKRQTAMDDSGAAMADAAPAPMAAAPAAALLTGPGNAMAMPGEPEGAADALRDIMRADVHSRLLTATATRRPFAERLVLFWSNHFTVADTKGPVRGLVGAFEREAIRPHIAGKFEELLWASTTHAAMLRFLDNESSAGPDSRVVQQRARRLQNPDKRPKVSGLNENLAREIMELHTLGVANGGGVYGPWGGYTQADVTSFAAVLTGWRSPQPARGNQASLFDVDWHEPGPKTVLGKSYPEGEGALRRVLHDLALHPSTSRFIATKLARHFVADDPPPALVTRLAQAYQSSDGDLPTVYKVLIDSPEAWSPAPAKLKTPEEFAISAARMLSLGDAAFRRGRDAGVGEMGQRPQSAKSPAGWPDRAEDWLGPDALWKRVEWTTRITERIGPQMDARALARASFGPLLSDNTATQIERASDGPQALALLMMSPEFQRR